MTVVNAPRGGGPDEPAKPTRREKAAATRARMLDAAEAAFIENGYTATRMTDIAERAGVAVQTLYYTFNTKIEVLGAVADRAVLGPDQLPPPAQPFWQEVARAADGRSLISAFCRGNTEILGRAAAIDEVAKAALHEPEAAAMVQESTDLRRGSQREVVADLADRFGLRPGLDVGRASDIFIMLCGTEVYLTLRRSGWTEAEYLEWVVDTLCVQLLDG